MSDPWKCPEGYWKAGEPVQLTPAKVRVPYRIKTEIHREQTIGGFKLISMEMPKGILGAIMQDGKPVVIFKEGQPQRDGD